MRNLNHPFKLVLAAIVVWLLVVYGQVAYSAEFATVPQSITREIDGKRHECFDTENYRKVVQYVKVIVPALIDQNTTLGLTLDAAYDEQMGWETTVGVMEHKLDVMKLDLLASTTELADIKRQIRDYQKGVNRATIAHYLIHGAAFIAVVGLGTAYGLEHPK